MPQSVALLRPLLITLCLASPVLEARGGHGGWGGGHGGWGGHPGWGHHPGWGRHGYWGGYGWGGRYWGGGWGWPYYGYGLGWGWGYPSVAYGFGLGYPWYGYGMAYGYPQMQQPMPSTYISDPSLASPSSGMTTDVPPSKTYPKVWHYCPESKGYYPNIKLCPSGWTEIPQTPEGQPEGAWYLCHAPEGYYPYVRHCDIAWEKVTPSTTPEKNP